MGREQDGLNAYLGDVNYKVKEENGTHGLGKDLLSTDLKVK